MDNARHRAVTVFAGTNAGFDPAYATAAVALGEALADAGVTVVYGGGRAGLMGLLADAALGAGGEVIGVIPEFLVAKELAHPGLSALEVVPSMHARKARMAELADGFVALPGGFGTLEETIEMLTWTQLGLHAAPVVLLDVGGYWGPLFALVEVMIGGGFVRAEHRDLIRRAGSSDEAVRLATSPVPEVPHKWIDLDRAGQTQPVRSDP